MKSRVGVPVGETLVFEDRTNTINLGQRYRITVKHVVFSFIERERVRTVEYLAEVLDTEGNVVQSQLVYSQQNTPFPFGRVSITVGMVSRAMVVLAVAHPGWLQVYPELQGYPLSARDSLNHEPVRAQPA